MRHLPVLILMTVATLLSVTTFTGCGGTVGDDARLTAADSLLSVDADSALALVESLSRDSLPREGDRAYRDLLVTQARYKCYITATSDSDINRALAYYRAHDDEREKLTRAYIYKGAVMEELGHPDSAMLYYKHAEATAAPDDYFNLGYVNMRMGALYINNNALDGKQIEKYEKAYKFFMKTNDSAAILIAMNHLGCCYRESKPNNAEKILKKALDLAQRLNDTISIIDNCHSLMVLYYENHQYQNAYESVQHILKLNLQELDPNVCLSISSVYSRLGILDSAVVFLNMIQPEFTDNPYFKMSFWGSLSDIALAHGDSLTHLQLKNQIEQLADSLESNHVKYDILKAENQYDAELKQSHQAEHKKTHHWLVIVSIILISVSLLIIRLLINHYKRKHTYDRLIQEIKANNEKQRFDLSIMESRINELHIQDTQLRDFINSHLALISDVVEACYHEPRNKLAQKIERIFKYQDDNKEKLSKLYDFIDMEYNDIMKDTKLHYPNLDERDQLLIALTCLGYSNAQIAMILGYVNLTSISGCRLRLTKKMGLNCHLNDYIKHYKEQR